MISTVQDILSTLAERGLSVARSDDGQLLLKGPAAERTPGVLATIKAFRREIDAVIPKPEPPSPPRYYLFRTGLVERHDETWPPNPPVGAWWFRDEGSDQWQGVPGTPGEAAIPRPGKDMPHDFLRKRETNDGFAAWWQAKYQSIEAELKVAVGHHERADLRRKGDEARTMMDFYRSMALQADQMAKEAADQEDMLVGNAIGAILARANAAQKV